MKKQTKALVILLSALVAVSCVIMGVSSVRERGTEGPELSTVPSSLETSKPTVGTTAEVTEKPTAEISVLGKWRDSADMSGYEFFSDGTVEMTYVNLTVPVINIPVNGVAKGTYTLKGDKLTTKFSIYSATIENNYKVQINGSELTMLDLEENEKSTYMRVDKKEEDTTVNVTEKPSSTASVQSSEKVYDDELIGSWVNTDNSINYYFKEDSSVNVSLSGPDVPAEGNFSGIYMIEGNTLTIQYVAKGAKVTEKYSYSVSKNSLSLKDKNGNENLFMREGTGTPAVSDEELLGTWKDSAGMSGFEFKPDGLVEVTYVNFTVPVLNIPVNGTYTGTYSIKDGRITVVCTVAGTSIKNTYEYRIVGNNLKLNDVDSKKSYSYVKQ